MRVLVLFSFIVTLFILAVLSFRLFIEFRLEAIRKDRKHSEQFRRKATVFLKQEQSKHLYYLITGSIGIIFGSLVLVSLLFGLQARSKTLDTNISDIKSELGELATQQKRVSIKTETVVKEYPQKGIKLSEYDWKKFSEDPNSAQLKSDIESGITKKIFEYFKLSNPQVSINEKEKSITIDGVQQDESQDTEKTLESNLTYFVDEAEALPYLKEIHFRLRTNKKEGSVKVHTIHFTRETETASFKKVNDFEQDIKQGGEKG